MSEDVLVKENNTKVLANIIEIIPFVIKNISEYDKTGSVIASDMGTKTLKSIIASRITSQLNSKGLL